jgi:oligoendopeptidase F
MQEKSKEEYNWNLKDIFSNLEEFANAKNQLNDYIEKLKNFQGKLNNLSDVKAYYEIKENAYKIEEKIACFVALNYHQDMGNKERAKLYKDVQTILANFTASLSFAVPELIQNSDEKLEEFASSKDMQKYERSIRKIIREKKHILSKDVENAIASYSEVFSAFENAYDIFTTTEFNFKDVENKDGNLLKMSHGLYSKYLAGSDRVLRKNAFEAMYEPYKNNINTITELYLARVKEIVITAKLRNYKNAVQMACLDDDSKSEVYDCLVESVNKNLKLNHEYLELKNKMLKSELNEDKQHLYDVYRNPLVEEEENIDYEDAKKTVLDALCIMGEDYISKIQEAMDNKWIDVYEKENKRTGAYSMGVYGVHPYILLNYVNSSRDVSTLAHELGHSMHSYYANTTQNVFNSNYTIMVAEVASTVNEILLANYQISHEENKLKKAYLINEQLDMIRATLYRQTMFAEFEKIVHEKIESGNNLSSSDLNELYYELVKKYFGDSCICDEIIQYEWARIPHFYSNFYVYKYATGITSAIVIATNIMNHEDGYVQKYIEMLSKGGAEDSLTLLKSVGVDLENAETYNVAFEYFRKNLEELKKLI